MRLAVSALSFLCGVGLVVYGVFLIYEPAAYLVGGLVLASLALMTDTDRGGKREIARRHPRK